MSEPTHPSITREPLRVRPPYDVRDDALDGIADTEAWRRARHLDRVAALREPLVGLEVTEYEHRLLEHLARRDTDEVAVVAALLWRCRGAASTSARAACPRCQRANTSDLGGYLECRSCGHGWAPDAVGGGEA